MHRLLIEQLGKRYNKHWIFKGINQELNSNDTLLIEGANGSGKSTLLKIISGAVSPTEGRIIYQIAQEAVAVENIFQHVSICAPYLQLLEAFTLDETLQFHQKLKPLNRHYTGREFADAIQLDFIPNKALKDYSSGMKQRVKLGLAIYSQSELLLLDEPISNLDKAGIEWYKTAIQNHLQNRIVIVCSNAIEDEHFFCTKHLTIQDFKIEPRKPRFVKNKN